MADQDTVSFKKLLKKSHFLTQSAGLVYIYTSTLVGSPCSTYTGKHPYAPGRFPDPLTVLGICRSDYAYNVCVLLSYFIS